MVEYEQISIQKEKLLCEWRYIHDVSYWSNKTRVSYFNYSWRDIIPAGTAVVQTPDNWLHFTLHHRCYDDARFKNPSVHISHWRLIILWDLVCQSWANIVETIWNLTLASCIISINLKIWAWALPWHTLHESWNEWFSTRLGQILHVAIVKDINYEDTDLLIYIISDKWLN